MRVMAAACCIVFFVGSSSGLAEGLTVIYDAGNTLPLSEYTTEGAYEKSPTKAPRRSETTTSEKETQLPPMTLLPIRTPSMSPGKVTLRTHRIPHFQVPLFIVGSDRLSKDWLQQRKDDLTAVNAVGLLVAAETERDINDMMALAEDLWLFAASGEDIAAELNLRHYPVLISKIGIEQ